MPLFVCRTWPPRTAFSRFTFPGSIPTAGLAQWAQPAYAGNAGTSLATSAAPGPCESPSQSENIWRHAWNNIIIGLLRMEKSSRVTKFSHQLITTMPTKCQCHIYPFLHYLQGVEVLQQCSLTVISVLYLCSIGVG